MRCPQVMRGPGAPSLEKRSDRHGKPTDLSKHHRRHGGDHHDSGVLPVAGEEDPMEGIQLPAGDYLDLLDANLPEQPRRHSQIDSDLRQLQDVGGADVHRPDAPGHQHPGDPQSGVARHWCPRPGLDRHRRRGRGLVLPLQKWSAGERLVGLRCVGGQLDRRYRQSGSRCRESGNTGRAGRNGRTGGQLRLRALLSHHSQLQALGEVSSIAMHGSRTSRSNISKRRPRRSRRKATRSTSRTF